MTAARILEADWLEDKEDVASLLPPSVVVAGDSELADLFFAANKLLLFTLFNANVAHGVYLPGFILIVTYS